MLSAVVELLLYNMFALSGITFIWLAIIEKMLFKKERYNTQLTKSNDIEQRNVWKTNIILLTYNRRFLSFTAYLNGFNVIYCYQQLCISTLRESICRVYSWVSMLIMKLFCRWLILYMTGCTVTMRSCVMHFNETTINQSQIY